MFLKWDNVWLFLGIENSALKSFGKEEKLCEFEICMGRVLDLMRD